MPKRARPATLPATVLAEVAAGGAADAGALPVELLGDFLPEVVAAVAEERPIPAPRLRAYQSIGERAARQGVALRALLDLYLSAAWRLWRELPPVREVDGAGTVAAGEVMLHAVDDVVAALTEGFQLARRALVRAQESARREFVDDLLGGAADIVGLLHRASGFGLDLAGPYAVATVVAERAFADGLPIVAALERAISGAKGDAPALLASKQDRLVVVFAAPDRAAVEHVTGRLATTLDRTGRGGVGEWRLGCSRARSGADGVVTSYRESLDALEVGERLGLAARVLDAGDLLAYQLLLRDRALLADVVEGTLGGLRGARGGAGALVETLAAYFDSGGNATAAARTLHLSVRALTYRLDRVRELTGRGVERPDDRFALQVAVLGAGLLGWPTDAETLLP